MTWDQIYMTETFIIYPAVVRNICGKTLNFFPLQFLDLSVIFVVVFLYNSSLTLLNCHLNDLEQTDFSHFIHRYAADFETIAPLAGEVGGEGLLSRNGSPGATKATMFSFLDNQNAG